MRIVLVSSAKICPRRRRVFEMALFVSFVGLIWGVRGVRNVQEYASKTDCEGEGEGKGEVRRLSSKASSEDVNVRTVVIWKI